MKKEYPRYRNNIFVKAENHLTRTINTYIEYEQVKKIYLSFNFKEDKYELHIKIGKDDVEFPDNVMLIYDREVALNNRTTGSAIFDILNSNDIRKQFKNSDIEEFKALVQKHLNEKTGFCYIFNEPSAKIISSIQDFIKTKKGYKHKPSEKIIDINRMVAKRIYNYVLHRINYSKEYFTKFSRLKNKNINKKIFREDFVKNEIKNLMEKINLLYKLQKKDYLKDDIESISTYKDIIICLELFDRVDFNISELTTLKTKEELLYEKALIEINIDLHNKEANIMNELEYKLKETFSIEFYDYIKFKISIKNKQEEKNKNKKEIFKSAKVLTHLDDFIERNESLKLIKGVKRRKTTIKYKKLFGDNFKQYNDRIIKIKFGKKNELQKLDEDERDVYKRRKIENYIKLSYLIYKMDIFKDKINIFNEKEFIGIFNKEELLDIFNGTYNLKEKTITILEKEAVLEETKIGDDYYSLINSYENDYELLPYLPEDKYDFEEVRLSTIKEQIDNLADKYNDSPLHPYAQDYLNKKNQQLQDYYDEFQEKASEQQAKEEYCMELYESSTEESYKEIRKEIKETSNITFTEYFLIPEIKKWSNIPPHKYKSFYDKIFSRIKMIDEIDYILGKKRVYHRP